MQLCFWLVALSMESNPIQSTLCLFLLLFFIAQGLRPVLKVPLNTGFDDWIAPL